MTEKLWPWAKSMLAAGHSLTLTIKPETRSLKENALLHALICHIAKTQEWAGAKRDAETWKRLLVAAWCRATGQQVEFLPALDGQGVDIVFRHTSKLTRSECAELIEFILAWGAQQGIEFPAPPGWVNPETGEISE